jgi:hypothetical protein
VREVLKPHIASHLVRHQGEWLFSAPRGGRMTTNAFADALRRYDRKLWLRKRSQVNLTGS